jgi:hypothetical protein
MKFAPRNGPMSTAPTAVERARQVVARLRELGFRPYLDDRGVLLISDVLGNRRDLSRYMPIVQVFDDLVAGLKDEPRLLE